MIRVWVKVGEGAWEFNRKTDVTVDDVFPRFFYVGTEEGMLHWLMHEDADHLIEGYSTHWTLTQEDIGNIDEFLDEEVVVIGD